MERKHTEETVPQFCLIWYIWEPEMFSTSKSHEDRVGEAQLSNCDKEYP